MVTERLELEAVICAGILPPGDQRSKGIDPKRPEGLQHGKALEVREAIKPAMVKEEDKRQDEDQKWGVGVDEEKVVETRIRKEGKGEHNENQSSETKI